MIVLSNLLARLMVMGTLAITIAACSSAPDKPQPAALPTVTGQWTVQKAWTNSIGPVTTPSLASVHGDQVAVASTQGQVALINASTGQGVWRITLDTHIQAGVSGDGQRSAVSTQNNEVVAIEAGKAVWRYRLPALSHAAPPWD